jgi:stearoyl-CoA desaturase (delta-9 desaturase)
MFVVNQSISALNSVLHSIGVAAVCFARQTAGTTGSSAWRLGGEGWHHNHHAFSTSASFGLAWYRADVSYWFILLLQRIGLAWDVVVPTREQIAARYSPFAAANGLATE